jgi:hypothetical protein
MQEEDSSVDRLKKSLYVRNKVPKLKERHELHEDSTYDVSSTWVDEEERKKHEEILHNPDRYLTELQKGRVFTGEEKDFEMLKEEEYLKRSNQKILEEAQKPVAEPKVASRVIKVVFVSSLIFFLFAVGLAGYFLIGGKNQVSCDNVNITIAGPKSVASGKKLSLDVMVKNNNPVAMNTTNIEMLYPEGSRDSENSSASISSTKELVGTINVGEQVRTTARALLFGQEQTETEIKAVVTYTIADSDATFSCEAPYKILIATAPVSLTVQGLEEISSGQELELTLAVTSNSDEIVPNLRLVVEYPYGFEFVSAEPKPSVETTVWELGDVAPGMERIIKLRGIVKGQGTEARTIGISVGGKDEVDEKGIETIMQKVEHPLLITRPFLELSLELNEKDTPQTIATLGEEIKGVLHWKNTLSYALHDVEIDGLLQGIMLDPYSVESSSGFFRSVDNTITWTPQTNKRFDVLEPGQEGTLSFSFNTKRFEKGTSVSNPVMNIEFTVRARRVSDNIPVPQNLQGQAKKTILFDTEVLFKSYALYGIGPLTNTGPHPPRVNEETTYTVALSIENNINDLASVEVRGELPVNVEWTGSFSPSNEKVVFNPVTREVIWSTGSVPRGTGYQGEARIVYFQVATIPSVSQLHSQIKLFENIRLQGVDAFTKNVLKRDVRWIETKLENDPYYKNMWSGVVQ